MCQSLKEIKTVIDNAKYICLFGIGVLFRDCFHQLAMSIGRTPDFLSDNAREKWGKEFFGIQCISPFELKAFSDKMVVIITVKNYEAIYEQLNRMGTENVFVACYDRGYNRVRSIKKLDAGLSGEQNQNQESLSCAARGKWTLITGASRGVGYEIAVAMAKLGSNIIAHSRSISHVEKIISACSGMGVQTLPIAAELSNLSEVEKMISELTNLVPQIDIIFNNAAIPADSGFWTGSSREYLDCFIVNTIAPIRICQLFIPSMMHRRFGRIINITSSVEKRPETMAYACSKAALDKFVNDLALSLEGTGVALSMVDPGWLRTDMTKFDGPNAVESVIPGALLGALLGDEFNGCWFSAQDYAGLSIESAIQKARFLFAPLQIREDSYYEKAGKENLYEL